jgi:outer membrane immunogenic protein
MRKFILPLIATLAIASPALANETRAEVRGGAIWSDGTTEDTYGAAVGYDFDLAPTTFAGVEVSGDKIATTGTKVAFGVTGRLGIKAATGTKVYAAGGYSTEPCDLCETSWHAGAGVEQNVSGPFYVKAEYRHYFVGNAVPDSDALVAGVGIKF